MSIPDDGTGAEDKGLGLRGGRGVTGEWAEDEYTGSTEDSACRAMG